MKKRITPIWFIILIISTLFITPYKVFAKVVWGSIGASSNGTFQTCGTTYNGCIGVDSYRYSIVKDVNIQDIGITRNIVPGTKSYEKKARDENSWKYVSLYKFDSYIGIIEDIKNGGSLFKEIIENTNVNMQDFFSNNYYIMIEVKHIIYYSDSGSKGSYKNNKTLSGYTSEIANALSFDIRSDESGTYIYIENKKATGLRSVTQSLPCYAYITVSGSNKDNYCKSPASNEDIETYLNIAKTNNRFGKVLVYANDIVKPKGGIKIVKTDSKTGSKIKDVEFKLYSGNTCSGDVLKTQKTNNSGATTFSNLNPGSYSVYESIVPTGYVTPSNRCTNVTVSAGTTTTKTITNTPKGGFTINKTNSTNDVLKDLGGTGPFFRLYNNSDCTIDNIAGNDNFSSGVKIENLDPGTYYILETQAKNGYHKPEPGDDYYCVPVTITAGGNTPVPIENKTECEYSFRSDMSMKERIELYNRISDTYGLKFNKLLNMSNITPKDACQADLVEKSYTTTCLGATTSSTGSGSFNENNLSMFTEKHGSYTFCLTTFTLENKLGTSDFGTIKSGRPIIKTDNVVAQGILNRVCYNYGDATTTIIPLSYSNYIKQEPALGGQLLIEGSEIDNRGLLNQTITKDYTLPQMYSHNIDGKIDYGYCPVEIQCKYLGRGIISKFNEDPGEKKLNFTIKLNKDKFGKLNTSTSCNYAIENELINNKNNINLEFRSVKTGITNSFFSKTGSGTRKIGANWSNEEIRKQVLELNNNSYNKNNEEPKYLITLTPSIIEEIRLYNKTNKYDDYDFLCNSDGTICSSNYLNSLKLKYDIKNDLTDGWKIYSTKRTCVLNPTMSGC